jgi:predicted nuclease of predicted toxin-antitoxin system
MRIKLDENLPAEVAPNLRNLGHDVHTVEEESLLGHSDQDVWEAAQKEQRCLITQDLDFSDVRRFVPGEHYGIIVIRLHSPSRRQLLSGILELFESESADSWDRCFVVATDRKVRVRRPK